MSESISERARRRHDLLTPMNHIMGYTEMLLEEAEAAGAKDVVASLRELYEQARQLLARVQELLETDHGDGRAQTQSALARLRATVERLIAGLDHRDQPVFDPDLRKIHNAAHALQAHLEQSAPHLSAPASTHPDEQSGQGERVLVVDDVEANRDMLARRLVRLGYRVECAENGRLALERLVRESFDLVLLDVMMPELDGFAVLANLKADPQRRHIPVIMISALSDMEAVVRGIELGAEDYLSKPFNPVLLRARVTASLEKKRLRDQEEALRQQVAAYTNHLEDLVQEKVRAIALTQLATIFALSKLAESRDPETGSHLERLRAYCRVLACHLAESGRFPEIDRLFIEDLYTASPLHDIGKVGIPDHVLQKPGPLTAQEYEIMKTHAALGADTLRAVDRQHPGNGFIRIGIEVAECHHERWDGTGYPAGLSGDSIPLSARILALADVYDALRSRRCYKASYSHEASCEVIASLRATHFDPRVVDCFMECRAEFDAIWLASETSTGVEPARILKSRA